MPGDSAGTAGARLAAARAQAEARLGAMVAEVTAIVDGAREANGDDEHDPEGATVAYERARASALAERARADLAQVDRALERLAAGAYGRCRRCGGPVGAERLAALPATPWCVGCAP